MAMISLFVNLQNNIILESLKAQHHSGEGGILFISGLLNLMLWSLLNHVFQSCAFCRFYS